LCVKKAKNPAGFADNRRHFAPRSGACSTI